MIEVGDKVRITWDRVWWHEVLSIEDGMASIQNINNRGIELDIPIGQLIK